MDPIQLLATGSGLSVLVALTLLWLRGDVLTKKGSEDRIAEVRAGCAAIVAELTSSRDEWKDIARESIADVGTLSEALTVRNRIDEALTKKVDDLTKAGT